jgi:hypothetical protein
VRTVVIRTRSLPQPLLATLLACCLILAGLAPSMSRVLAASGPGGLSDLCVSAGSAGSLPSHPGGHFHEAACALCLTHGGSSMAPPPAPVAAPAAAVGLSRSPALVEAEPGASPRWRAPPSRAPPAAALA